MKRMGLFERFAYGLGSALVALTASVTAQAADTKPLETVPKVDLKRYLGKWYEIARNPAFFQKNCYASTAEYSLREDGDIKVVNSCHKGSPDGKLKVSEGKAWVTDKETGAKLKVMFVWPFSGKYWVIDLGTEYEYAVVGEPKRNYLWILSRTPAMDPAVYNGLLERLKAQGYDTSKLIRM
ncbi:MAG: lipocalin family protein [Myxococcota bacterium]|jgi:apolipoprotein D and lipocalin family protein